MPLVLLFYSRISQSTSYIFITYHHMTPLVSFQSWQTYWYHYFSQQFYLLAIITFINHGYFYAKVLGFEQIHLMLSWNSKETYLKAWIIGVAEVLQMFMCAKAKDYLFGCCCLLTSCSCFGGHWYSNIALWSLGKFGLVHSGVGLSLSFSLCCIQRWRFLVVGNLKRSKI